MKRIAIVFCMMIVSILSVQLVRAFEFPEIPPIPSIPSSNTPVGGTGGGVALEIALNAKIDHAKCAFKDNTNETTCDLRKLGWDLATAAHASSHAGHSVTVNITAGPTEGIEKKEQKKNAQVRADAVRDEMITGLGEFAQSWRFNTRTAKKVNKLTINARVD